MISTPYQTRNFRYLTFLIINIAYASSVNSSPVNPLGLEYPIRPLTLTFGVFEEYKIENPQHIPFMMFAIGNDDVSIRWLTANSEYFRNNNSIGFLISADYPLEIEEIRERTGFNKLFLMPNVDELVTVHSIPNYPFVLDTQRGLVRQ